MEIDPRYIGIKYAEMFKCAFWFALSQQQTHAHKHAEPFLTLLINIFCIYRAYEILSSTF
jgi:hypothetical protein